VFPLLERRVRPVAEQLTAEFGSGFSKRNLDYFRRFYLEYANRQARIVQTTSAQSVSSEKSQTLSDPSQMFQTLSGELQAGQIVQTASGQSADLSRFPPRPFTLGWSHYVFLLGVKNPMNAGSTKSKPPLTLDSLSERFCSCHLLEECLSYDRL
jgi:hypothetical protein